MRSARACAVCGRAPHVKSNAPARGWRQHRVCPLVTLRVGVAAANLAETNFVPTLPRFDRFGTKFDLGGRAMRDANGCRPAPKVEAYPRREAEFRSTASPLGAGTQLRRESRNCATLVARSNRDATHLPSTTWRKCCAAFRLGKNRKVARNCYPVGGRADLERWRSRTRHAVR